MLSWCILFLICLVFQYADSSPQNGHSLLYNVFEEQSVGTRIGEVIEDAKITERFDGGYNCQLFDMSTTNRGKMLFRIDANTCEMFVSERINRESLCELDECSIILSVFVGARLWITVTIKVLDVNDHTPLFDPPKIEISVKENVQIGHSISLQAAVDHDKGSNGLLAYSLEPSQRYFDLEISLQNAIKLIVKEKLDYEEIPVKNFSLKVQCCDHGSPRLCGTLDVFLMIIDINDNAPVFVGQTNVSKDIYEDAPIGTVVTKILAIDADQDENGRVSYSISKTGGTKTASQYFSVNRTTGEIVLTKSLQLSGTPDYFHLLVTASDGASVPLSSACHLHITVRDVNNHAPIIMVEPTMAKVLQIAENLHGERTVGLIKVTDGDSGNNGLVTCGLNQANPYIQIKKWSTMVSNQIYSLLTSGPVDREQIAFINVSVTCTDHGEPPKATHIDLSIKVTDINEFEPTLELEQENIGILENVPHNSTIVKLTANDQDAEANLTLKLDFNHESSFWIDDNNNLKLRTSLDRETQALIHIIVMVVDSSPPMARTATATVSLTVLDVNDNEPRLLEPRSFHILENLKGFSSKIGTLRGIDPDSGKNGSIKFKLLEAVSATDKRLNHTFSIDENNGQIFSLQPVDREETPEILLRILLHDEGSPMLSKKEVVHLTVVDENDHKPMWRFPTASDCHINFTIPSFSGKYAPRKSLVTNIRAFDPDSPRNANITYHLLSALKNDVVVNSFLLETFTGHLLASGQILEGSYVLRIEASDNGKPPLVSDIATLYITALFEPKEYLFGGETDRLSLTLIVALASVTFIICLSLLAAIVVVRRHRYGLAELAHLNTVDQNSIANESLAKWTEEQNKYLDTWAYASHYCSYPVIPGSHKLSGIGEPLLPPPGPHDVLQGMNNNPNNACSMLHLRRPANQDIDVASADSGRGASEEENNHQETKLMGRTKSKPHLIMPTATSVCECEESSVNCYPCLQYVTYSPNSMNNQQDFRATLQLYRSPKQHLEDTYKGYHTLNTMVSVTSAGHYTEIIPIDTKTSESEPLDLTSFRGQSKV